MAGGREPVPRAGAHGPPTDLSGGFGHRCFRVGFGFGADRRRRDAAAEEQRDQREHREHRERGAQAVEAGVGVLVDDGVGGLRRARRRRRARLSRSASEMNGTPLVSSVCAFDVRSSGTPGCSAMPVKNDAVSADISTAPASAVPIESPRLETVFWSPPTSPLCSSGTAETVTAPSCEASAPMPSTGEQHRPGDDLGAGAGVERGDEHDEPEEQHEEPELADPPRRRVREHLRDPDRGDQQGDRQRQEAHAGVDRREPERDREEQRHREEQAGLEQVLEEERGEPAAQQPDPQDRRDRAARPGRCRGGASPRRGTRAAPRRRRGSARSPATARATSGASGFGLHEAPRARAQDRRRR